MCFVSWAIILLKFAQKAPVGSEEEEDSEPFSHFYIIFYKRHRKCLQRTHIESYFYRNRKLDYMWKLEWSDGVTYANIQRLTSHQHLFNVNLSNARNLKLNCFHIYTQNIYLRCLFSQPLMPSRNKREKGGEARTLLKLIFKFTFYT